MDMHLLECVVAALAVIGVGLMLLSIWTARPDAKERADWRRDD